MGTACVRKSRCGSRSPDSELEKPGDLEGQQPLEHLLGPRADPRKARAMTDAKGRMNELYEKLKTGQYADELEALLHEFAVALETENKANVTRVCSLARLRILGDLFVFFVSHHCFPSREQVHKVLAGSHWEDLGSKVMIGIKRIMDIAMP